MQAKYLNPVISAFDEILSMTAQAEMQKKEANAKQSIDSEKEYALYMDIKGDLNGFFSVHFDKAFGIAVIDKLTGGMGNKEEIDEMSKSGLSEIGGMVKSKILTELSDLDYTVEIENVAFKEKHEVQANYPFIVQLVASTEFGDTEIYVHLS